MVIPHYIFRLCNLNHKSRPILYVLSAYKVKVKILKMDINMTSKATNCGYRK